MKPSLPPPISIILFFCETETLSLLNSQPPPLLLATTILLSDCSVDYSTHLIWVESYSISLTWLACFIYHNVLKVDQCYSERKNFLSLYGWIKFHCLSLYHVLLIHLSVNLHLCCFCMLTMMSNASMNMNVWISLWDPALRSFGYTLRSDTARSCVISLFNF